MTDSMVEHDVQCPDFGFHSGVRADLRLHYRTLGAPRSNQDGTDAGILSAGGSNSGGPDNAVLLLHGTTGSGTQFLTPSFASHLFGPGQPLDLDRYFVVVPDAIGHGESSKPSDGSFLDFPAYGYRDLIAGHVAVLNDLGITRLRLVLGTSMGAMQTWLWASSPPVLSDAYVAVACEPVPVSGRNLFWRQLICSAIRGASSRDAYHAVWPVFALMSGSPSSFGTRGHGEVLDSLDAAGHNAPDQADLLYALEASADYRPQPEQIDSPLTAVRFDTDEVNPVSLTTIPELARRLN